MRPASHQGRGGGIHASPGGDGRGPRLADHGRIEH
jgi:hypothetical protein